ncbi:MAG: universal stress protein [Azospirillaceae bacterium]
MFNHAIIVLESDESPPIDALSEFLASTCRRVTLASVEEKGSDPDQREQSVRGLVARCRRRRLHVGVARLNGHPGTALQTIEARSGGDLIIFPADGDSDRTRWRMTRTRRLALQRSRAPLWFWTEAFGAPPRIAALADPDDTDHTRQGLNIAAIHAASRLAAASQGPLSVINSCLPFGTKTAAESPFLRVSPATLERECAALAEQRRLALFNLLRLSGLGWDASDIRVIMGDTVADLPEIVERDYDLVVMGCCGRSHLRALLRPNTAERLLPRLSRSVLVLKTPLQLPIDDRTSLRDPLTDATVERERAAI